MAKIFFIVGAVVDIIATLVALGFVFYDAFKGRSDVYNPTMVSLILLMVGLIASAFYLKSIDKISIANAFLWVPGFPIFAYGLFILAFIILKPAMK